MIYVILFFLSELCDSYCIYRLIRGLSGECRVKHVWEVLCYPVYGLGDRGGVSVLESSFADDGFQYDRVVCADDAV